MLRARSYAGTSSTTRASRCSPLGFCWFFRILSSPMLVSSFANTRRALESRGFFVINFSREKISGAPLNPLLSRGIKNPTTLQSASLG